MTMGDRKFVRANYPWNEELARAVKARSPHYEPVPVEDISEPSLDYEYCFEIAGGEKAFQESVGCVFVIKKTQQEDRLTRWEKTENDGVVRYRVLTSVNEPKQLIISNSDRSMGISQLAPITLNPVGTSDVLDAYVPLYPYLVINGEEVRATEGYFYHFNHTTLIQEYHIKGDGNWTFWATESDHKKLSDERRINREQSAILMWWKQSGVIVDSQYLVYLETPLTTEELEAMNEDWLLQYGMKIDIPQLVESARQPYVPVKRTDEEFEGEAVLENLHQVKFNPKTSECETWSEIAAMYGMAPRALLDLNPSFNSNPLSLAVGDELKIS